MNLTHKTFVLAIVLSVFICEITRLACWTDRDSQTLKDDFLAFSYSKISQGARVIRQANIDISSIQEVIKESIGEEISQDELLRKIKKIFSETELPSIDWIRGTIIINKSIAISVNTGKIIQGTNYTELMELLTNPVIAVREVLEGKEKFYYLSKTPDLNNPQYTIEIYTKHFTQDGERFDLNEDKNFMMVRVYRPDLVTLSQQRGREFNKAGYIVLSPIQEGHRLLYALRRYAGSYEEAYVFPTTAKILLAMANDYTNDEASQQDFFIDDFNQIKAYLSSLLFSYFNDEVETKMKRYILEYTLPKIEYIHSYIDPQGMRLEDRLNEYPEGREYLSQLAIWEKNISEDSEFMDLRKAAVKFVEETEKLGTKLAELYPNDALYLLIPHNGDLNSRLLKANLKLEVYLLTTADKEMNFVEPHSIARILNAKFGFLDQNERSYFPSYYKIYTIFEQAKGQDIQAYFHSLLDLNSPMRAFIKLVGEIPADLSNYSAGTIAELLYSLGENTSRFGDCCDIWNYYYNLGINIEERFNDLLLEYEPKDAFQILWEELLELAPDDSEAPNYRIRELVRKKKMLSKLIHFLWLVEPRTALY